MLTHETTEQRHARAELDRWIANFRTASGRTRRSAAKQLRAIAKLHPWLGDAIPDDVWDQIYHVSATGTVAPPSKPVLKVLDPEETT